MKQGLRTKEDEHVRKNNRKHREKNEEHMGTDEGETKKVQKAKEN